MKVAIYTLGCKVNQFETQALEGELIRRGHEMVPFEGIADAYIINTCTVTALSDKKSRQSIRRARKLNPSAVVAVCGCYSQVSPGDVEKLDVDLVAGTGGRLQFIDMLENTAHGAGKRMDKIDVFSMRDFEPLSAGGVSGRTRALLKVQDGCANFCSYCIIPYARGPVRSLPIERAADETRRLYAEGYRELVITGIEIASYGADFHDGTTLTDLISAVCLAAPDMRVRLGSLEPRVVDAEFCRALAPLKNLCPHFHLSLQSGCDATLARMRRKYDTGRYFESVSLLRDHFPHCAVATDLIVGFPGEDEDEFSQTLEFIKRCGFSSMHIFPYSRRQGTPAAAMPGQIPRSVKTNRASIAAAVAREMEQAYLQSCIGLVFSVLFETQSDIFSTGHAENYAEVEAEGTGLHGLVRNVEITGVRDGALTGHPDMSIDFLKCPVCGLGLFETPQAFKCPDGHSFDRSSKGYVNLLIGKKLSSGDSRDMVLSRRRFLERGHYAPLSEAINEAVFAHMQRALGLIADAGCGEGYFLKMLASHMALKGSQNRYFGFDISKRAVHSAASNDRGALYAVAQRLRYPTCLTTLRTACSTSWRLCAHPNLRARLKPPACSYR